jgi:hypothetical protein
MTKGQKITAIIFGLLVFILAWNALVVIPREKMKQERDEKQNAETLRKWNYDVCIADAVNIYDGTWNGECKLLEREKECALPAYKAQKINDALSDEKDRCVSLYK